MDIKKISRTGAKIVFYGFTGIAGPSILKTGSLLKREMQRTADNTRVLKEMAAEAREAMRVRKEATQRDYSLAKAVEEHPHVSLSKVYLAFLARKRAALCCLILAVFLGLPSLLHGHLLGALPLIIGGAMSLEFAWLAEFRLWQLRGKKLSKAEQASLHDFWMDPGAWIGTFNLEGGYGLSDQQKNYRRWLWIKRFGLLAFGLGALCTIDLYFSQSRAQSGYALCCAIVGLVVAMLVEFHLRYLRFLLAQKAPVLALFRFESGACYKE